METPFKAQVYTIEVRAALGQAHTRNPIYQALLYSSCMDLAVDSLLGICLCKDKTETSSTHWLSWMRQPNIWGVALSGGLSTSNGFAASLLWCPPYTWLLFNTPITV